MFYQLLKVAAPRAVPSAGLRLAVSLYGCLVFRARIALKCLAF